MSKAPLPGLLFVLSAPAGTGKTTLVDMLTREFPQIKESVSYTTRFPRPHEVEGIHYHFVDEQAFEEKMAQGEFLESVVLYGQRYGTSRRWIDHQRAKGQHVVLVIDTQGAMQLRGQCAGTFIFIMPPSWDELKRRLTARNTESATQIEERLAWAIHETKVVANYDYCIVNEDLQQAYQALRSIVIAEEHRLPRALALFNKE